MHGCSLIGMGAPVENQHASKGEAGRASSFLHVRCTPSAKAAWVNAASGVGLSEWVIAQLNAAAGHQDAITPAPGRGSHLPGASESASRKPD
jgi:hypothetical protein